MVVAILTLIGFVTGNPFLIYGDNLQGIVENETMGWTANPVFLENSSSRVGFFFHYEGSAPRKDFRFVDPDLFHLNLVAPTNGVMFTRLSGNYGFAFSVTSDRTFKSFTTSSRGYDTSKIEILNKQGNTYMTAALFRKFGNDFSLGLGIDVLSESGLDLGKSIVKSSYENGDSGYKYISVTDQEHSLSDQGKDNLYIFKIGASLSLKNFRMYPVFGVAVFSRSLLNQSSYRIDLSRYFYREDNSHTSAKWDTASFSQIETGGVQGSIVGFQSGVFFDHPDFKGSIFFESLKGGLPIVYEDNTVRNSLSWLYDTTSSDTEYTFRKSVSRIKGLVYGDPKFFLSYRRLMLNAGNSYDLTENFNLYVDLGIEYLDANFSGSREFEAQYRTFEYDTSSQGYTHRDTLYFRREMNLKHYLGSGEITRVVPSVSIAAIFRVVRSLSIGGILMSGYASYRDRFVDQWETSSFLNYRFLMDARVKNWEFVVKTRNPLGLTHMDIFVIKRF